MAKGNSGEGISTARRSGEEKIGKIIQGTASPSGVDSPLFHPRVPDEAFFEQDPNAARFRDLARTLLNEPGATKEDVRETLKGYGVDDQLLDRILHVKEGAEQSQKQQLQQQAQGNPAGEGNNQARENEIREAALRLTEIREKGNKGTKFLYELKKQNYTPEEIARIDAAGGEPAPKRSRGDRKPGSKDVEIAQKIEYSAEAATSADISHLQELMERIIDTDALFTALKEEGWQDEKIFKTISALKNSVASSKGTETPAAAKVVAPEAVRPAAEDKSQPANADTSGSDSVPKKILTEEERVARNLEEKRIEEDMKVNARWINSQMHEEGKTFQEVYEAFEKAGAPKKLIDRTFSFARGMERRRAKAEAEEKGKKAVELVNTSLAERERQEAAAKQESIRLLRGMGILSSEKKLTDEDDTTFGNLLDAFQRSEGKDVEQKAVIADIAAFASKLTDPNLASYWAREYIRTANDFISRGMIADGISALEEVQLGGNDEERAEATRILEALPKSTTITPDGIPSVAIESGSTSEPAIGPLVSATEPEPTATRIEAEEQDMIDRNIAAAHGDSAIEQELKSFDEAFDQLYPTEPGWLTTSAPDDIFDAFHQLKHEYRNAVGEERDAVANKLHAFLNDPEATGRNVDAEPATFEGLDEDTPLEEGTPLEWKNKLKGLIEGAKEKLTPSAERSEKMKNYLKVRASELGELAKSLGPVPELMVRGLGTVYNDLGWKSKLLVGSGLGLGAFAFLGVSIPIAAMFATGLTAQRVAGMAGMFLKIEKYLQDHKGSNIGMGPFRIREEKIKGAAAFGAIAYTALMGAAIGESIHLASESSYGQAVHEWLGKQMGLSRAAAPSTPGGETTPAPTPKPDLAPAPPPATPASGAEAAASAQPHTPAQPAAAAAAEGAARPLIPAEVATIDIKATEGRGYEYMTKRLWEQLQEKNIKLPSGANPNSDLAKLLAADKDSIDGVVHRLAQENKFFRETGASVRIDLDSHMSIDSNGNIILDGKNLASSGSPTNPAMSGGIEKVDSSASLSQGESLVPDATNERPAGVAGGTATEVTVEQYPSNESPLIEKQEPAPVIEKSFVVNKFDLTVPLAEPHVYAGPTGEKAVYAFGGDKKARLEAIYEYLSSHPTDTVIAADETEKYRAIWSMKDGKMTSSEPLKKTGFLGIFNTFLSPPEPGELTKLIK